MIRALLKLLILPVLFLMAVGFLSRPILGQSSPLNDINAAPDFGDPELPAQNGSCQAFGNNSALRFGDSGIPYQEARTVAILNLDFSNQAAVESAINQAGGNNQVVIRYGGSKVEASNVTFAAGQSLGRTLNAIAANVNYSFIAQVSHNEANCGEFVPLSNEQSFMRGALATATDAKITAITGQIDTGCDINQVAGATLTPIEYARQLIANQSGLDGLAIPFYTADAVDNDDVAVLRFQQFANLGLPVYVTESGPFKTGAAKPSDAEFASYVSKVLQIKDQAQIIMLFNAFGLNKAAEDSGNRYDYAEKFWNPACRAAFRTQCAGPNAVDNIVAACGGDSFTPSSYYLYPIRGMTVGVNASYENAPDIAPYADAREKIIYDLAMQGYEVRCSTPKIEFLSFTEGETQEFQEFIDATGYQTIRPTNPAAGGYPDGGIETSNIYDLSGARVPLLRDEESNSLMDSLETYFGFVDSLSDDAEVQALRSAPIDSWTTLEHQCEIKKNLLEIMAELCSRVDTQGLDCGLYAEVPIKPEFGENVVNAELLNFIRNSENSCEKIADPETQWSPTDRRLLEGFKALPYYLQNAYRYAFLVQSLEQKKWVDRFSFLGAFDKGNNTNEVRVLVFRVPDFSTNKNLLEFPNFPDGLNLTKNIFLSKQEQDARRDNTIESRKKWMELALAEQNPNNLNLINCGGPGCEHPLTQALVNTINAQAQGCEPNYVSVPFEESSQIDTPGNLPFNSAAIPNEEDENEPSPEPNLELPEGQLTPDITDTVQALGDSGGGAIGDKTPFNEIGFDFLSYIDIDPRKNQSDAKIAQYLILPQGVELEFIEQVLLGSVYTLDQIGALNANYNTEEFPAYFKVDGVNQDYEEQLPFERFGVRPNCVPSEVDDCQYQITYGTRQFQEDEDDFAPRILGAKLGFAIRKIQENSFQYGSSFRKYVASCKTTEEFLTLTCAGDDAKTPGQDGDESLACVEKYNKEIPLPRNRAEVAQIVNDTVAASGYDVNPAQVFGHLNIEGSPFLRAVRQLEANPTSAPLTITCNELLNNCGAIGPFQFIDGACTQPACEARVGTGTYNALLPIRIDAQVDPCNFESAIIETAKRLDTYGYDGDPNRDYLRAGRYAGLDVENLGPQCTASNTYPSGADPIQGCNGLNYCQCAVDGFDDVFECLLNNPQAQTDPKVCF